MPLVGGYWPSGQPGHWPNQGSSMMGSAQAYGRPSALARVVSEMRMYRKIASVGKDDLSAVEGTMH